MRVSKVENSHNKAIYEKMRLDGAKLKDLSKKALELGENISQMAFSRYFSQQWSLGIQARVQSDRLLQRKSEQLQAEWKQVMELCYDHIEVLRNIASALVIDEDNPDSRQIKSLVSLLKEARLTGKDMFEYIKKINELRGTTETDKEISAMKVAIKEVLPIELAGKLLQRYEEELLK